ncbi:MAG: hypothetical protein JXQ65_05055 [Candidatus Marinimicrobia bacterium]|nr:hypothetical protein [Candidatus Neomarinimicrobiota bacterium]
MNNLQNINSVQEVLEQELDCFHLILKESKQVFDSKGNIFDNDYSIERIAKLLESRARWIELLKRLEQHKVRFSFTEKDHYEIQMEISKIAKTLVDIDAKLLDFMQMKKINKVKEILNITDNKNRSNNRRFNDFEKSKLIDIRQE